MQQYLFRGKRIEDGRWIYGSLISWPGGDMEIITARSGEEADKYLVIPETVGMQSAHELKLFDGDIVNYVTGYPKRYMNAVVEFGEYETYTHFNKEEGDVEKHFGFYINDGERKLPLGSLWLQKIGTRYDNPELVNPTAQEQV